MLYWIQVNIYAALMCLVYLVVLRNRPMHGFNRFYLLSAVVLPLILPFMRFPEAVGERLRDATALNVRLPEFIAGAGVQETIWNITGILWAVYATGAVVWLSVTLYRIITIRSVVRKHRQLKRDGYTLVPGTGFGPGSWHSYIFLPGEEENETVIGHELAHIKLQHTKDIMLLNIVQAFSWPNMLLVWIKKELVQVHEFQADAATRMEAGAYAALLVSNIFGRCTLPATHSFFIHPVKRRIMMLKRNSNKMQRFATGLIAIVTVSALVVTALGIQSCKRKNFNVETTGKQHVSESMVLNAGDVDVMPRFNGDLVAYLGEHIKYPKEAMAQQVEGKVFVEFVVDEHGKVKDARIKKSPNEMLSQAALEVVGSMPDWIPGEKDGEKICMAYTLPISYKLN